MASAGGEYVNEARGLFAEIGSTVWHAKALILMSDVCHGRGEIEEARRHIDAAIALLITVDSMEAARLRVRLETTRSALLSCPSAGEQRG
jgi:hypothetical protein